VLAVEASGLQKRYAGAFGRGVHDALRGVDLVVPRGRAFGLIGPNGAGKTTFVKALLGIVRATEGSVRLFGMDPSDPRARARVGYVPERLALPPAWTPLEILASVARLKAVRLDQEGALALLRETGVVEAAGRKARALSKGMRQRVALACALVGDPDLLVLDEPTDGLDPLGRIEVRNLLADRLSRGATLFLNSHLLAETERICDRIGILAGGRILREGPIDELTRGGAAWTARFAPDAPAAALEAAGFVRGDGGTFVVRAAGPAELAAALDGARAAGALLVGLEPQAHDLEQILLEVLRGEAA